MARLATSWTLRGLARRAVVAACAALAAVALCLVVLGTSQKQLQLGVLLGLWSALLAAYLIAGARQGESGQASEAVLADELAEIRSRAEQVHEAQLEIAASQQQVQATRQAYLTQEIERVLSEQLGSLREEVAALRAEIADKLGGQLLLERVETTRVIGSDLEALQNDIRRLATAHQQGLAAPARAAATSTPVAPERQAAEIVDAELVEFPPPAAEQPDGRSAAQSRAGRRRAPEPEPSGARYQGRRRADGEQPGRFAQADS